MAAPMLSDFRVVSLNSKGWYYRGEGNKSLVIAIPKERAVLRFTKTNEENTDHEVQIRLAEMKMQLEYSNGVLTPLLGEQFIPTAELIRLPSNEAEEMNHKLEGHRSEFRKLKCLPVRDCCGLHLRDCAFLPEMFKDYKAVGSTIAVELKPKMGFLPTSSSIPKRQKLKAKVCRYQLMQRKKLRDGRISHMSGYCPLDLFSGCPFRMKRALGSLMTNPQNNLAIFKDGEKVFGEGEESGIQELLSDVFRFPSTSLSSNDVPQCMDNLVDLLVKVLRFVPSNGLSTSECHTPQICHCSSKATNQKEACNTEGEKLGLPKKCVLGSILSVQKLDTMDVEGIFPLFQEIMPHKSLWPEEKLAKWLYGRPGKSMEADTDWKKLDSTLQQSLLKVREFLMAASLKDCSVMIVFQELVDRNVPVDFVVTDLRGVKFLFSVAILDIDMKPVARIPKYLDDERDLVSLFGDD